VVSTGFEAEGFEADGSEAAGFAVWGLAEAAWIAGLAGFAEAIGFREPDCLDDLLSFEEPLNISDSQPASLASIGNSTDAAIAAMMAQRRGQMPWPALANFLSDDSNPNFTPGAIAVRVW
jgi:hypothetical protein